MPDEALTYRSAGVDIDTAYRALRGVAPEIEATYTENVVEGIGGFGGLYQASFAGFERPVLVSSIDGIGTKTMVAALAGSFEGLGHDIVNHCANDILCQGARPLFFMDYFGCSKLNETVLAEILRGASAACKQIGAALIGGETAEMPGVYAEDEFDVVGAIVGVVDLDARLPRPTIQSGDSLIGLASSGLHTNGFSLARKALLEEGGLSFESREAGLTSTIGEELLRPHKCYVPSVLPLLAGNDAIRGISHITGGGLLDNVPRMLPAHLRAVIERRSWTPPAIFQLIQERGNIPDHEMLRTFNMGIGMVLAVDRDLADAVVARLVESGEAASVIGSIQGGPHDVQII
jgi:phosphoribosylformylglycinamidine cyclo-ligase